MSDNDYELILRQVVKNASDYIALVEAKDCKDLLDPCRGCLKFLKDMWLNEVHLRELRDEALAEAGKALPDDAYSIGSLHRHNEHQAMCPMCADLMSRIVAAENVIMEQQKTLAHIPILRQSLAERTRERDLAQRLVFRLPMCPDHRDKFSPEHCQACRAERAEKDRDADHAAIRALMKLIDDDLENYPPLLEHAPAIARAEQGRKRGKG